MQLTSQSTRPHSRLTAWARHVVRSEDGNLFIVFFPMLIIMMLWGGIAIDLMRFESRRATLQSVTDRATLAAANLDQKLVPKDVVDDYFRKAGINGNVSWTTNVETAFKRREVSVDSGYDLDTLFMRYLTRLYFGEKTANNFDTLRTNADSTAVQGVGAVEVSLVLDLSGSMFSVIAGTSPTVRRIDKLRTAATQFVNALLQPAYKDRISISLVPYSEQVNIGPTIFNTLKIDPQYQHNFSHCIEFPASAFSSVTFDATVTFDQTQNIQTNAYGKGGDGIPGSTRNLANPALDQPVCPRQTFERVIPLSQNATALTGAISKFEPRGGTSIFLGLKWGITLLDPSFQSTVVKLPSSVIDAAFADRPEPYEPKSGNNKVRSLKYIVLMTDGYNDYSYRLRSQYYDDPSERLYWAHHNLRWVELDKNYSAPGANRNDYIDPTPFYTPNQGVDYMRSMCKAAKDAGIIIYAISMSGDDSSADAELGRTEMASCASSANHFFTTSGAELEQIFARIAEQITDLRLTQ